MTKTTTDAPIDLSKMSEEEIAALTQTTPVAPPTPATPDADAPADKGPDPGDAN